MKNESEAFIVYFRNIRGRLDPATGETLHGSMLRQGRKSVRTAIFTESQRKSLEEMKEVVDAGKVNGVDFSQGPDGLIENWRSHLRNDRTQED